MATGKPHNPKLITVFKNLGKWIRDVYRAWTGGVAEQRAAQYKSEFGEELPQLSEEVQRVMDRMLNAEADLYQAEVSESMRPLFDEKPKDMSEDDWIDMQKAHDEALADGEALLNEAKAKDEKWYSNARAKTLRMIQRKAKEIRDKVKEGVTAEIEAEAGTRAYELIKKSNETFGINWKFDPDALTAAKISSSAIKKLSALGLTKKGGMAPSEVMELMRGQGNAFATVQDMVQGLLEGARKDERIEEETTRDTSILCSGCSPTPWQDCAVCESPHQAGHYRPQRARHVCLSCSFSKSGRADRLGIPEALHIANPRNLDQRTKALDPFAQRRNDPNLRC